jgi:hypothetical protein
VSAAWQCSRITVTIGGGGLQVRRMAIVPGDHNSAREMRTMEITAAFLEQNLRVLSRRNIRCCWLALCQHLIAQADFCAKMRSLLLSVM